MKQLTLGADIEFMLRAIGESNLFVPACGLFGGTKDAPLPFPNMPDGFMYQEDGAALEVNIPICQTIDEFIQAVRTVRGLARNLARDRGLTIVDADTVDFGTRMRPDIHANAFAIGCNPDSDAYSVSEFRDRFNIESFGTKRFAGAHIHVGFDKALVTAREMVRKMDEFLYIKPLISQGERLKFYGYPGLYRDKPYGAEYRSLGPLWTSNISRKAPVIRGLMALSDWYDGVVYNAEKEENNAVKAVA